MTESLGFKPIFVHDNGGIISPIFLVILEREHKNELVVSFSGTKGPSELIEEIINSLPKKYALHENDDARVFAFFYDHYVNDFKDLFFNKISELLSMEKYDDYKIVFTGHSLGGALALHAAADGTLSNLYQNRNISIYTYGQPRVGNREFYNLFLEKIDDYYRLVHHKDLVAHVPPCIPDFSGGCLSDGEYPIYPSHGPTEIFYDEDMESFTICDDLDGEDPYCSNSIFSDSFSNHKRYFGEHVGHLY
eukprot:CAMPEP_0196994956 /NCGR_PEP_ID=MMETSP1380-20130617/1170_1 /TAXON_ID=5936 /ORGANISM="Euplotes crassus, Strain CT5" /LENGTH=247 /DNA_ID=CAMNT_0042410473 /DNA_START=166 /DNA_END=906 /DNA_ORIENTATION=-